MRHANKQVESLSQDTVKHKWIQKGFHKCRSRCGLHPSGSPVLSIMLTWPKKTSNLSAYSSALSFNNTRPTQTLNHWKFLKIKMFYCKVWTNGIIFLLKYLKFIILIHASISVYLFKKTKHNRTTTSHKHYMCMNSDSQVNHFIFRGCGHHPSPVTHTDNLGIIFD